MDIVRNDAVAAWLAAIAEQGWQDASLDRAAALSGIAAADIIRQAGDKVEAVALFQERVARESAAAAAGEGSVRERLFEGLMRGFDLLQEQRAALLKMRASRDPGLMALVAGRSGTGLRRLAVAAGAETEGVGGKLRQLALAAIGAKALDAWVKDESADLSATMAELDRLLVKAERAETEGFSLDLVGLSGLPNPFDRGPRSLPDPRPE